MKARALALFVPVALATLWAGAQAALSEEPAFVRAQPFVVRHLATLLAAAQQAGVNPASRPSPPSPCNATDHGDVIRFTWNGNVGAVSGFYVFRDDNLVATLGPATTSFFESPGLGTHVYCVLAFNPDGVSDACCDSGTQDFIAAPQACGVSPNSGGVIFHWNSSVGADGYRVYRDGTLIATTSQTFVADTARSGPHEYCVEAFHLGFTSERCCVTFETHAPPLTPPSCAASNDLVGAIRLTWEDVADEDGYLVYRDGLARATLPANTTQYLDAVTGSHHYCVRAFNAYGSSPECCSDGFASTATFRERLSWDTCSPQVANQNFSGPAVYNLVISVTGSATTNVGHDSELRLLPAVPDAWRFDGAGCQTTGRLNLQVAGIGDTCPAMLGANPLAITSYFVDVDGSAKLRLSVTYDDLATAQDQRYVLWKIAFDHTHSIAGTDADPATCDGASTPLNFSVTTQIALPGGLLITPTMEPADLPVTWNGGSSSTRTKNMTWGRLKGLYR